MSTSQTPNRSYLTLFALILAGEMVFSLPFHITRFFRPSYLDVFSLTNTQLGDIFALYGIVAMLAYFPSGFFADRFSVRKLLSFSLLATALGGVYLIQIPSTFGLQCLFAYWGLTSILLFWAALIKATREWGGPQTQGRAFGLLDAGRGLLAAAAASLAVIIFEYGVVGEALDSGYALQDVIVYYVGLTFLASVFVWFFVPDQNAESTAISVEHVKAVVVRRVVWVKAMLVFCAYCGFKSIDNFGLYATDVLGMSELESAQFTSQLAYLRPICAIVAGFLADRILASNLSAILFALATLSFVILGIVTPVGLEWLVYSNLLLTTAVIFGVRGVYFALVEETNTSHHVTGLTVGLISVIGFFPDVFFAPLTGRILDQNPGLIGFQHYFLLLAVICMLGLIAAMYLIKFRRARSITH